MRHFLIHFSDFPIIMLSVDKYKTEEEKTLTRKISKLNMHSIGKKSTRIGQRFLSSIGIESTVKF